ncbi:TadE/TadG family type IV pilus assembly protein [uncultured Roseobacter sp.]|uniref:TadE/TadG family type IV pilus assembly protein n=1 Tax=uncultured Roseobacter sp. TaxID=114847 RepID=UPI002609F589|nr:TadE/TadG family type IV pilus assembly protein [uncultured Roseobacter sp.]
MIRQTKKRLGRFRREEDGQIAIEFVILVPLIFTIFLSSIELGIYSMRQMWMERGLEIAVRTVRLSTGNAPQHDELKTMVCEQAPFLPDCENRLKLEMTPITPTAFAGLPPAADCVDTNEEVNPPRTFVQGGNHDLMLIRACLVFDPVIPTSGLGFEWDQKEGLPRMVAMSAFVQEPNE